MFLQSTVMLRRTTIAYRVEPYAPLTYSECIKVCVVKMFLVLRFVCLVCIPVLKEIKGVIASPQRNYSNILI